MSSNDIVKYLTQEFVKYIDTPKSERKRKPKELWSFRLFGMIPMSLWMFSQKMRKTKPKKAISHEGGAD